MLAKKAIYRWMASPEAETLSLVTSPMVVPVPVGVNAEASSLGTPCLPPHPVSLPGVGVAVRVGTGQEVPVDLVQVVRVGIIVVHQLVDEVGGHGGGDPLPGVNSSLQPYVGGPRAGL